MSRVRLKIFIRSKPAVVWQHHSRLYSTRRHSLHRALEIQIRRVLSTEKIANKALKYKSNTYDSAASLKRAQAHDQRE